MVFKTLDIKYQSTVILERWETQERISKPQRKEGNPGRA